MERKFEIMDALGDVNTFLVEEAIPGGKRMKERFTARVLTAVASLVLVTVIGVLTFFMSGGLNTSGTLPGASGGDVYASSETTGEQDKPAHDETAEPDKVPDEPFYLKDGKPVLLSEMSDEAIIAALDAVTGESRTAGDGSEYRYGLYNIISERFRTAVVVGDKNAAEDIANAVRAVAAVDEKAIDGSFYDDYVGIEFFPSVTDDIDGDEDTDGAMYDGSEHCRISEFCAAFDLFVMRYYLEYYDVYEGSDVITPERIGIYFSTISETPHHFKFEIIHLWPERLIFDLVPNPIDGSLLMLYDEFNWGDKHHHDEVNTDSEHHHNAVDTDGEHHHND